ncbi:MAG: mechanosensitive ion channel domain-containing protein [Myxococcota bacterium]
MTTTIRKNLKPLFLGAAAGFVALLPSSASAQEEAAVDAYKTYVEPNLDTIKNVALALLLLLVARFVAGWASALIRRGLEARKFDTTLTRFFASAVRIGIMLMSVLAILGMFGVETTSFAAVIGALGLAIGLAFQGTLGNFAAGVMLLVFRPFKVGDAIVVDGEVGTVNQIDLFTTGIATLDNKLVMVPNGNVFGNKITNITHYETRRVDIDVGVDYSADIDKTREVLTKAIESIELKIEEPDSVAFLKGLGGSSVDWQIRVWCKTSDYWAVYEAGIRAVKMHLDEAGIGIPFPQMDVHLDKLDPAA